ncbi:acetyltransferase [Nitritalea halalkaliphila LW7]|uniref:Acetyltransferase n=1 Tax=Nitritalea halalkaliphila LW7 TaxID=1189621 RepID=I5BTG5_9BACT|nr:acetyltransferase [Nitritalea halalkaliphila]EIM72867.1 acetyltransferase [Nitritalea halalkaliphila LW7]
MTKINILGASGHAKVIVDIIQRNGQEVGYVFDDNPAVSSFLGHTVLSRLEKEQLYAFPLVLAIGKNCTRRAVSLSLDDVAFTQPLIHPSAIVSELAHIGKGTVVMPGAIVNAGAFIGEHCIINTGAVIEHDCILHDFVHISPNAILAGGVEVLPETQIGMNASVIQNVTIGAHSIVGAGSVVIEDIPDHCTAVGVPAKPIKLHKSVF